MRCVLLLWATTTTTTTIYALKRPASWSHLVLSRGGSISPDPTSLNATSEASSTDAGDDDGEDDEWFDVYEDSSQHQGQSAINDNVVSQQAVDSWQTGPKEEIAGADIDSVPTEASDISEEAANPSSNDASASIGINDDNDDENRMELADAYDGDETVGIFLEDSSTDAGEMPASAGGGASSNHVNGPTSDTPPSTAKTTIDTATAKLLRDELGYRKKEVAAMRPDVAAIVAQKRLSRPVEGMPTNWYQPTEATTKAGRNRRGTTTLTNVVRIAVPVAAVGIGVILRVRNNDGDVVSDLISGWFKGDAAAESEPVLSLGTSTIADDDDDSSFEKQDDTTLFTTTSPETVQQAEPSYPEDELDVTWLDKLITKVERNIKAFLRIKI